MLKYIAIQPIRFKEKQYHAGQEISAEHIKRIEKDIEKLMRNGVIGTMAEPKTVEPEKPKPATKKKTKKKR